MTRELFVPLLAGASLAVASSAHCALMCGPLANSARLRGEGRRGGLRYFAGRLVSYTVMGGLAGSLGKALLTLIPHVAWFEAAISFLLALVLLRAGLRLLAITPRAPQQPLVKLGKGPRRSGLGRMLARVSEEPLLFGAATALLPCGALYAALAAAAALGSAWAGSFAMASFAALSGLVLSGVGQLSRLARLGHRGQRVLAVGLLGGAALMVWRPVAALRSHGSGAVPACHGGSAAEEP